MNEEDEHFFLTPAIRAGLDWKSLELAVVRMVQHQGWLDVKNVGQRGDKGADVLATRWNAKSSRYESYLFQVKAISSDNYIGTPAIEEALAAQSVYGAQIVVVVTNGEFTKSAYNREQDLNKQGFTVRLWNGVFLDLFVRRLSYLPAGIREPRGYQAEIINRILENHNSNIRRSFFIMATGLGKTVVAATATRHLLENGFDRVLVLCHSVDLAIQLEQAFWSCLPKTIPTRRFMSGSPPLADNGVVFGLYQTLIKYLGSIPPNAFDLVIVDEAHHALASAFTTVINHLRPKHLISMTATPWRGDGKSIESLLGEPIARISLLDGMRIGYLARVNYQLMCDNINWDEMQSLSGSPSSISDLNKRLFLPQRDDAVVAAIRRLLPTVAQPRILVFSASILHAEEFANRLTSIGIPAGCASTDDRVLRNRMLLDFSVGKLKALTAVDVLNEGIDIPCTNILVFLRATHSRRIFVQQLGRGLRLAEGKDSVIVLDFVTDIRRMAAVASLDRVARQPGPRVPGEVERVILKNGVVTFSNDKAKKFIDAWLNDVADLEDTEDAEKLVFPEI